jgi:hypothetical protein
MRVAHCGADVFAAHQLLNRADVLAAFQVGVMIPEASTALRTAF